MFCFFVLFFRERVVGQDSYEDVEVQSLAMTVFHIPKHTRSNTVSSDFFDKILLL